MAHLFCKSRFETVVVGVVVVEDRGNLPDVRVEHRSRARLGECQMAVRVADWLDGIRFVGAERLMAAPRSYESEAPAEVVTQVPFQVQVPSQKIAAGRIGLDVTRLQRGWLVHRSV